MLSNRSIIDAFFLLKKMNLLK